MEIVLNKESKRKTPVAIAFRNDERTVGEDAYNIGVKFPSNMYFYLLELLGKTVDNPIVQLYQKRFPYYKIVGDPERHTVLFEHDGYSSFFLNDNCHVDYFFYVWNQFYLCMPVCLSSETKFSPEELVAMILTRAKEYAESFAHQQITESVITVPAFFNQAERRAMLKAAELAGLKGFIN